VKISDKDIVIEHVKGSGPGGQHRNKRETGIRITHLPTGLTVMATEERYQSINLERAKQRLQIKIDKYYFRHKPRVKTKATWTSKLKRLESKKSRSLKKQARKPLKFE